MLSKQNARFYPSIALFAGICLSIIWLWGLGRTKALATEKLSPGYPIQILLDQMTFSGDVTSRHNCVDATVCSWLENTPTGTIILGVDPTSPLTSAWDGGSATAEIYLPDTYTPSVIVLKVSWPDRDGKGLHSPEINQAGRISLDGKPLWDKRTTQISTFNDYYAAQHEPILTTIVVTQSMTHTLSFSVTPRTAWDLSQIELHAHPMPLTIQGIGYSPFRDCQFPNPDRTAEPSLQEIEEDLYRLVHTTNAIRTYASTGVNGQIPALANATGLPIYAGAWIDEVASDTDEIQGLITLANTTKLAGAIVGNEYYLRHRTPEAIDELKQYLIQVKDNIPESVPVTTAEIDDLMFVWSGEDNMDPQINPVFRPILNNVDFVMVHIYPFWKGMPIEGAAAFAVNSYKAIQAMLEQEYPVENKWVIIGETGWPSSGTPNHLAVPSLENQRRYLLEFLELADKEGVEYLYFDAFDELWKIEEPGRVGQAWGYSYTDRSAKHPFYGVLLPPKDLITLEMPPKYQAFLPSVFSAGTGTSQKFPVYGEWPAGPGHFVPSGWMGDNESISLYSCDRTDPHNGDMALRATFSSTGTLGWSGVYWRYPENNWGDLKDGLNLSWADKLTFWAKGETGGEKMRFLAGGIGTQDDPYPDSLRPPVSTGYIQLENQWQQYTIDLRGQDLSHLIGGFAWVTDQCANPKGATFYLDDIFFEEDPNMPPSPSPGPVFPVYTDAAVQDNHFVPGGWMGDGKMPGRVSLTECWRENPHSGETAIRISYTEEVIGWAGIYWVHPAENWGDRPGGIDLTGADRLTFWARSDTPNTRVKFLIGGVACSDPSFQYPDSVCPKIEKWENLTTFWTQYVIDLGQYSRDLSSVVGGFGWVSEDVGIFYLDDILYEFNQTDRSNAHYFATQSGVCVGCKNSVR